MRGRRRTIFVRVLLAAAAAGVGLATASLAYPKPDNRNLRVTSFRVDAKPITRFDRFGRSKTSLNKLRFIGGLSLTAPGMRNFGGWSGIALDPDGAGFVAISDSGVWMRGRIVYTRGAPSGIANAEIGPIRALDGKPLHRGRDRDSEAIARESGTSAAGTVIVAFERNSRLARYAVDRHGFSRTLAILEKPPGARAMRRNAGFEAMTVMKGGRYKGRPVAISERLYDRARNHTGWIWTEQQPKTFHLRNIGDFDITDIASLDDGSLYVLERRFRWLEVVKMRIRRIEADALRPEATLDGEVLIEADLEDQIDNMEGLDVTRMPGGDIVLTVISDDNFNRLLQRNLLLQFALRRSNTAKARP
jgi:hypothetical protein